MILHTNAMNQAGLYVKEHSGMIKIQGQGADFLLYGVQLLFVNILKSHSVTLIYCFKIKFCQQNLTLITRNMTEFTMNTKT